MGLSSTRDRDPTQTSLISKVMVLTLVTGNFKGVSLDFRAWLNARLEKMPSGSWSSLPLSLAFSSVGVILKQTPPQGCLAMATWSSRLTLYQLITLGQMKPPFASKTLRGEFHWPSPE